MTRTVACLGDSQTQLSPLYAVPPEKMWVEKLAVKLRGLGANVRSRAYGIGGQTTGEMFNRVDILSAWEVPDIAVFYGGVNDNLASVIPTVAAATAGSINVVAGSTWYGVGFLLTYTDGSIMAPPLQAVQLAVGATGSIALTAGAALSTLSSIGIYVTPTGAASAALATASNRALRLQTTLAAATGGSITTLSAVSAFMPTAGTQAMTQAFCKAMKYGVRNVTVGIFRAAWIAGQAALPANAEAGQRLIVLDDTSATGGMAAAESWEHARIAGDYSAAAVQSVWECRTPQAGEAGWGRVAVTGTAAFTGCCAQIVVVSTNYLNWTSGGDTVGAPSAVNAAVRVLSLAAATAEAVAYSDLWSFQSGLIIAGETTQGSNSWHAIANNQHHNAYGHDTVARATVAAITAQQGWLSALSA